MVLLVFICNRPDKLDEVLEGFLEIGITGATIVDSVGMGRVLSSEIPIFAGFRSLFRGASSVNRTILSVIRGQSRADEALRIIEDAVGPLGNPGNGIAFTIPVETVRGLMPELG